MKVKAYVRAAKSKGGSKCPIIDNAHGKGLMGGPGLFVMRGDCPLHGYGLRVKEEGDG